MTYLTLLLHLFIYFFVSLLGVAVLKNLGVRGSSWAFILGTALLVALVALQQ